MAKQKETPSLNHGSSRVARLARWLGDGRPPGMKYDVLRLEVRDDGEWSCLQLWQSADVTMQLADDIDELVRGYANEQGSFTTARVAWWSEELKGYSISYTIRVQPDDVDMGSPQAFSGNVESTNIQTQRHLEFMMRQHVGGNALVIQTLRETLGYVKGELGDTLEERARLRSENFDLREENMRLSQLLEQALERAEGLAEQRDTQDQENNVITLITQAAQNHMAKKG